MLFCWSKIKCEVYSVVLLYIIAVGAPIPTARELDDVLMHQSTIIVDNYEGARAESGDIILSKVRYCSCCTLKLYCCTQSSTCTSLNIFPWINWANQKSHSISGPLMFMSYFPTAAIFLASVIENCTRVFFKKNNSPLLTLEIGQWFKQLFEKSILFEQELIKR